MWKVNAGRRSKFAQDFARISAVAIGWREMGNLTTYPSKAGLVQAAAAVYPDKTARQSEVSAAQIWRFIKDISKNDDVITYDPLDRIYLVGKVESEAAYRPELLSELPTIRMVRWTGRVSRDDLSKAALGRLGALLTLFQVAQSASDEILALQSGATYPRPEADPGDSPLDLPDDDDPYGAIADLGLERIKDRLSNLSWEDMQEIVAALLRALGYRTIVSPAGADRGKDIIASRDGFGFERPRIIVEVKHRRGAMGAPEIRSFIGGRHADDRGLYVSTGGFTREAYYEAERASTVTHLMTLDGLARALVENYEQLDERGRNLLPLTKLYWPT